MRQVNFTFPIYAKNTIRLFCLLSLSFSSCKKFVNVSAPITSVNSENVYTSDATAIAVLTGVYTNISAGGLANGGISAISLFPALSADELTLNATGNSMYLAYYINLLTSSNTGGSDFWNNIYPYVYTVNGAVEGLTTASGLTPAVKQQLMGEAKFLRAFLYYLLVSLYGDVPLVTGTNYTVNQSLPRTPKAEVWQQIISDLKDAQSDLSPNFLDATLLSTTTERVRPTSWAATALLARAYLYTQDWNDAAAQSTAVINNSSMFTLAPDLDSVFLMNSTEAIWQLQPVIAGDNTFDALLFILPSSGPDNANYPVYLDTLLVNSFEPGDARRINWIDSVIVNGVVYYYPSKYKVNTILAPVTEYEMVLRLAEQYLIRAESNTMIGNFTAAINDLDTVRSRAGLPGTSAGDQTSLITAILHERQVELFTEWGHRWLDLKRTGTVGSVMGIVTPLKGGAWNANDQLYPIPLTDMQADPNLVQNAGY
jgi:hypothetical protein